jgi:hypothetical protein
MMSGILEIFALPSQTGGTVKKLLHTPNLMIKRKSR